MTRADRIAALIEAAAPLWAQGVTTPEMARRLGVSVNVIVGMAYRNRDRFPERGSPLKPRLAGQPHRRPAHGAAARARAQATSAPQPAPAPTPPALPPAPPATVFRARAPGSCCWPMGEPRSPGFRFCGAVAAPGRSYCGEHVAVAYQPARPRAEART